MQKKIRWISWIPAVTLMIIIFIFSAKNGVESTKASHTFSEPLLKGVETVFHLQLGQEKREQVLENIDFIIRKLAHLTEYLVLSLCVAFFLWSWNLSNTKILVWMVILTAIYASSDEIHQLFVPGRSGQIRDVLIDTSGALCGMLGLKFMKTKKEKIENV